MKLTPKQDRFCREYITDLNATQAAMRSGYSPRTARSQGQRLLTNVDIQDRLAQLQKVVAEKLELRSEHVLQELQRIAFGNMADYIGIQTDGSAYVDLSKLTREQAAAIGEILIDEYTEGKGEQARNIKRTRFKLADKLEALRMLGQHLRLFDPPAGNANSSACNVTIQYVDGKSLEDCTIEELEDHLEQLRMGQGLTSNK